MKRDNEALTKALEKLIEKEKFPGVSVCVRGPEGIMYEKGFGYRSIKRQTKVNPDTVFGIASMSKSFTTLACCILSVEGKMNLDDPMVKYFPTLHLPGVPDELVTVKQMGLHRAGIPPMEPLEWSIAMNSVERESEWHKALVKTAPNKMNTIEQIVNYISEGRYPALGEPGEYMSYSNEAFALLSYVVDQAAGITLEEFLMERIFKPLGMTRSILDLDASEIREMISDDNITSLFEKDEQGTLIEDDDYSVLPPFRGCACIKSTARDITKYYQMLSNWGEFEGKQIVPREAIEMMVGAEYPLRRKPFNVQGLRKRLIEGKMCCEHGGALHGVSTHGGYLEGGYSMAVLCNESEVDVEPLQWVLYNWILGVPLEKDQNWCHPSGKKFSREDMIVGDYVGHEGIVAHALVYKQDDQLVLKSGDEVYNLEYCEATVFAAVNPKTGRRADTYRFFLRDGRAWAVKAGSRIFRRV